MTSLVIDEAFEFDIPDDMVSTHEDSRRWTILRHPDHPKCILRFTWRTPTEVDALDRVEVDDIETFLLDFTGAELDTLRDSPELASIRGSLAEAVTTTTSANAFWSDARTFCAIDDSRNYIMILIFHFHSRYLWQFIATGSADFLTSVVDPIVNSLRSVDE